MRTSLPETNAIIDALKKAIWDKRPILGEIMQKHGDKTLNVYARDFMDVNPAPGLDNRKPELISLIEELVAGRLDPDTAKGVAKQLTKLPLVSTADHHAFIDHPFWVNANIISGIPLYEMNDPDIHYLIVLSFSSVSMNNASGFSRGILFSGEKDGKHSIIRLPILPDKLKMSVVYNTRAFTQEDLDRAKADVEKKVKAGDISAEKGEAIRRLIDEYFAADHVLRASHLCSQITRINHKFWSRLFHCDGGMPSKDRSIPELVYFDIETLVTQALLRIHLPNADSLIHKMLFDTQFAPLIRKYFDGLPGAFSLSEKWGTYLFWGIGENGHRVSACLKDGILKLNGNGPDIPWNANDITNALKERKIFPSMLLCYLIISLYYGMKCLGGFCQVHDLTVIKEAWRKLMMDTGNEKEAEAVVPVQTKELGGDGMVLAYMKTLAGGYAPSTGFDMIMDVADTQFQSFVEVSKHVTLMDLMQTMLPEMYTVLYPEQERDATLLTLSPEEIFAITGLQEKLQRRSPLSS